MTQPHQTQIIKIGNSKGVRIPKEYITALGTKEVVLEFVNNSLVITPIQNTTPPRSKWNSILAKMTIESETEFDEFDITHQDGIDEL
jgi:antitoxin MazE